MSDSFQDGCDIIMEAVTAKGSTPVSNSPEDIATAINNISTGRNIIEICSSAISINSYKSAQQWAYSYINIDLNNYDNNTKIVTVEYGGAPIYAALTVNIYINFKLYYIST